MIENYSVVSTRPTKNEQNDNACIVTFFFSPRTKRIPVNLILHTTLS